MCLLIYSALTIFNGINDDKLGTGQDRDGIVLRGFFLLLKSSNVLANLGLHKGDWITALSVGIDPVVSVYTWASKRGGWPAGFIGLIWKIGRASRILVDSIGGVCFSPGILRPDLKRASTLVDAVGVANCRDAPGLRGGALLIRRRADGGFRSRGLFHSMPDALREPVVLLVLFKVSHGERRVLLPVSAANIKWIHPDGHLLWQTEAVKVHFALRTYLVQQWISWLAPVYPDTPGHKRGGKGTGSHSSSSPITHILVSLHTLFISHSYFPQLHDCFPLPLILTRSREPVLSPRE